MNYTIVEQNRVLKILKPPTIEKILIEVSEMLELANCKETVLGQIVVESKNDPFKVLISTILSQRTKDEVTSRASKTLFRKYSQPSDLAKADKNKIQNMIKPVGFYRIKAQRIIEVSQIIIERFNGKTPSNLKDLLSLPSVGRKTANCVLVYGFQKAAIPVDTHVHRISNRLNIVQTKTPEKTEFSLTKTIPEKYWLNINDLFVRFGQTICKPIKPRCEICTLKSNCAYSTLKESISKSKLL